MNSLLVQNVLNNGFLVCFCPLRRDGRIMSLSGVCPGLGEKLCNGLHLHRNLLAVNPENSLAARNDLVLLPNSYCDDQLRKSEIFQ